MAKYTEEEKLKNRKEFILEYLVKEKFQDYEKLARETNGGLLKTIPEALDFIKENMTEKDYYDFYRKALPFEPIGDFSKEEAEELKEKALKVATDINFHKAGLLEMLEVAPNIHAFKYMTKLLRYKYNLIGASVFSSVLAYYDTIYLWNYNKLPKLSIRYSNVGTNGNEKLIKLLEERNLPINDITYQAAYITAKSKGIIKQEPLNDNKTR